MKTIQLALLIPACALAAPSQAQAQAKDRPFEGPRVGLETTYEDYGSNISGAAIAVVAGWDFKLDDKVVLGLDARYTLDRVNGSRTTTTPGQLLQTADVTIDDNWGLGARVGYALNERLLVFAQGGYERFDIEAVRTLSSPVCASPGNCVISRTPFPAESDMWTAGVGVEWAATRHLWLRGQYT